MALCFRRSLTLTHKEILVLNIVTIVEVEKKKENHSHRPAISMAPLQMGTNTSLLWTCNLLLAAADSALPARPDALEGWSTKLIRIPNF